MFKPGERWHDTEGNLIQAHGGGILFHEGVYYWFGENKNGITTSPPNIRTDVIGVSCYSSRDLEHWKFEALALEAVLDDPNHDLHPCKVLERPKVIRNPHTGQFVLFAHVDDADYGFARVGVAVSDHPRGPYNYLGSQRPCGFESRDLAVFQDGDGSAYLFFSSTNPDLAEIAQNRGRNYTLRVARLSQDYLHAERLVAELFSGTHREAPTIFKHEGVYHLISSGCTSWNSNAAEHATATSIEGSWTVRGNPCLGLRAETTFDTQGTFVLPLEGQSGKFVFMADRWNPQNLSDSRYVWLPIQLEGQHFRIVWQDSWRLK